MKTEEFKIKLQELGFDTLNYDTHYINGEFISKGLIIVNKETGNLVATVHLINQYDVHPYPSPYMTEELFDLLTTYSKTPTEER